MSENSGFTHLHLHTEYSLLDGANKIEELAHTLHDRGDTAAAITDHGNMFGAIDFYKKMKKNGIKPLIASRHTCITASSSTTRAPNSAFTSS